MPNASPADIAFDSFLRAGVRDNSAPGLMRQIALVAILDCKARGGDLSYALERSIERFNGAFNGPRATLTTAASYARALIFHGVLGEKSFAEWIRALPYDEHTAALTEQSIAKVDVRKALATRADLRRRPAVPSPPPPRTDLSTLEDVRELMKLAHAGDASARKELAFIKTLLSAWADT